MRVFCNDRLIASQVRCAADRMRRGIGLMGRRELAEEEGLLIDLPAYQQGKTGMWVAVHLLCVPFPLAVAWLDQAGIIVHAQRAQPWGLYYSSPRPAWYTLELHVSRLRLLEPGRCIRWEEESP